MSWIRSIIEFFRPTKMQEGGWCGCCDKWMHHEVVPEKWPYSMCKEYCNVNATKSGPTKSEKFSSEGV